MSYYTYKIITGIPKMKVGRPTDWSAVEQELNSLVAEGWELVSSDAVPYGLMTMASGMFSPAVTLVLRLAAPEAGP